MANFTRVLDPSLVSRFLPRRAGARRRFIAALVAAVVILSSVGSTHRRLSASVRAWSDTHSMYALPSLHSLTLHRAEYASRSERRLMLRVDAPLAAHASHSLSFVPTSALAPLAAPSHAIAPVIASGYDATAPPVS